MMQLVFLHGPAAVGKLTVARALAARTGLALFHNHLVVDAAHALFEFGSPPFVRVREAMWGMAFDEAARAGRSLVFTFAPENTVRPRFVGDTVATVERHGGRVRFVALTCPVEVQEMRVGDPSRAAFGKLRSLETLRRLRADGAQAFPPIASEVTIDTSLHTPEESAALIASALGL
ncbi:MAG TPA: shikimate kinase [Caulobacteraceae bacterium]|nr:shikimate kinase [Caulobacteraceae bacterium]